MKLSALGPAPTMLASRPSVLAVALCGVLAAAGVVAALVFAKADRGPRAVPSEAPARPADGASTGSVQGESIARPSLLASAPADERSTRADLSPHGSRWSDHFVLVDADSGEPIAHGEVWLIDRGTGRVEVRALGSEVGHDDERYLRIAALTAPTHCLRFVDLEAHLSPTPARPIAVEVGRATTARIEVDPIDEDFVPAFSPRVWLEGIEEPEWRGPVGRMRGMFHAGANGAEAASDAEAPSDPEAVQRRIDWFRADEIAIDHRALVDPEEPFDPGAAATWSHTFGASDANRRLFEIHKLPSGATLVGTIGRTWRPRGAVFMAARDTNGDLVPDRRLPPLVLDDDGSNVWTVTNRGEARVIVDAGEGATQVFTTLYRDDRGAWQQVDREGSSFGDRRCTYRKLVPGSYRLVTSTEVGERARAVDLLFDLAPDEHAKFDLESLDTGRTLAVWPRLVIEDASIDGLPPRFADRLHWRIDARCGEYEDLISGPWLRAASQGDAPVTIEGLPQEAGTVAL